MLFEIEQDDVEMLIYDEFYLLRYDVVDFVLREFLVEISRHLLLQLPKNDHSIK